jgi:hypothetical protein
MALQLGLFYGSKKETRIARITGLALSEQLTLTRFTTKDENGVG